MDIQLEKGVIAIGYGGKSNYIDQTKLSLKLANKIAETEKVLFLNWNNYTRMLEQIIKSLKIVKNRNLEINTNVGYFGLSSFLEIIELIEKNHYTTIFIDNFRSFTLEELDVYENDYKNTLIKSLTFLYKKYSVRIVFNVNIDPNMFSFNYNSTENSIDLGYFRWSRNIINDCNQVFAVQNLEGYLNTETDEYFENNTFNIFELKNQNDKLQKFTLKI